MTTRITQKDLTALVNRINDAAGTPRELYATNEKGEYIQNKTAYHLQGAYGGWKLCQGGGKEITYGYISKRELYEKMLVFLNGMYAGKGE